LVDAAINVRHERDVIIFSLNVKASYYFEGYQIVIRTGTMRINHTLRKNRNVERVRRRAIDPE
jgi:hypothetical protein